MVQYSRSVFSMQLRLTLQLVEQSAQMSPLLPTNTSKENLAEFLLENAGGVLNNFIASSEPLSD